MGVYLNPAPSLARPILRFEARRNNPFQADDVDIPRLTVSTILEAFQRPEDRKALALELQAYQSRLQNFKAQPITLDYPETAPVQKVPFIEWGHYQASSWDQPLATAGMFSCSTLVAIDPVRKQHFLAHVFPNSNLQQVAGALKSFIQTPGDSLQLIAVPGILDDFWRSMDRIREGLRAIDPSLVQRITYAGVDPNQDIPGLILWQGQLYRYSLTQAPPPSRQLSEFGMKDTLKPQPLLNISG